VKRPILFAYQLTIGLSDACTGALLVVAPATTLRLLGLHAPQDAQIYLSFIGSFVLGVGLCCLFGAYLAACGPCASKLRIVWLLTATMRIGVALFIFSQTLAGTLEAGWIAVALFDAACGGIQAAGLRRGWLVNAPK
jgi:hypothetical protein